MPWRGLEWRLGFQVNFTKLLHETSSRMLLAHWSSPQRLPVALPHCTCPLRWDDALARWTPLASTDNGEMPFLYNAFSPEYYNFHHNMSFPAQNAKKTSSEEDVFFVRTVRLELTQANAHYPLKVACLPFHHVRNALGLQSYELKLKNKIFLNFFCVFLWSCSERRRNCVGNSSEHTA